MVAEKSLFIIICHYMCSNHGMLEMSKEAVEEAGGSDNKIVEKSVPAKKEWVKAFDGLHALAKEVDILKSKINSKRDALWAQINEDLDSYGVKHLHYNEETREIEYMAERE